MLARRIDGDLLPPRCKVTVSGSFHGDNWDHTKQEVLRCVHAGLEVLSPDPRQLYIVGRHGDFDFLAGDRSRSKALTQDGHHRAIRGSNFLWIASRDGYVGKSTSMEIGFAIACNVPVFSNRELQDDTVKMYVKTVASPSYAAEQCGRTRHQLRLSTVERLVDVLQRDPKQIQESDGDWVRSLTEGSLG